MIANEIYSPRPDDKDLSSLNSPSDHQNNEQTLYSIAN